MKRGPYGKNKAFVRHKKEMHRLRKEGYGYGTISKMLNVPIHVVQYFTKGFLIDLGSSVTKGILYSRSKRPYEKLSWNELSLRERRERILEEQNGKCLGCCGHDWRGAKLVLQLDHIDGDNKNDVRENLRFLCPNCHSQTPTWGMNGRTHTAEAIAKFSRKKL